MFFKKNLYDIKKITNFTTSKNKYFFQPKNKFYNMAKYELKLPNMGESVEEATITSWRKQVGQTIAPDEIIVEVATDKVDSEIPSEVAGKLVEILFEKESVVKVGQVMAIIEIEGAENEENATPITSIKNNKDEDKITAEIPYLPKADKEIGLPETEGFLSPLVKNIIKTESISQNELDSIKGTGKAGRITKDDLMDFLKNRGNHAATQAKKATNDIQTQPIAPQEMKAESTSNKLHSENDQVEIIELTRMGKLISKYMVESKRTSPHVQSFSEVDVTRIWNWRNKVKGNFEKREGEKFTFTPIFMEAVARALRDFPMMNVTTDGERIFKKKNINIGMATALPNGDLIVPVIKNADQLSLIGLTKKVNDLAQRARNNKLKPDEVKDGTYTVTNIGSFGNVFGTPIINQPEVGILAIGSIQKVPSVIETPEGDVIGIRYKMILSHSYDHRVVNGALGGMFVQRVAYYLENWDTNREL